MYAEQEKEKRVPPDQMLSPGLEEETDLKTEYALNNETHRALARATRK